MNFLYFIRDFTQFVSKFTSTRFIQAVIQDSGIVERIVDWARMKQIKVSDALSFSDYPSLCLKKNNCYNLAFPFLFITCCLISIIVSLLIYI